MATVAEYEQSTTLPVLFISVTGYLSLQIVLASEDRTDSLLLSGNGVVSESSTESALFVGFWMRRKMTRLFDMI